MTQCVLVILYAPDLTSFQRLAPPPPKKSTTPSPSSYAPSPATTPIRAAPALPAAALDRSTSQRAPPKQSKSQELGRANTMLSAAARLRSPSIGASQTDLSTKGQRDRERERERERERDREKDRDQPKPAPTPPQSQTLAKQTGIATPRRREKKGGDKEDDIIKRLQQICTDADPTKLYRNLVKIGQG